MASYRKDDLCAKAAPPRHAPSPKGPVFVTLPEKYLTGRAFQRCISYRGVYLMARASHGRVSWGGVRVSFAGIPLKSLHLIG